MDAAKETASTLLDLVSAAGTAVVGPEGAIDPMERALMEDPLARILERSSPDRLARYGSIVDPLMLGLGAVLYAVRVQSTVKRSRPAPERPDRVVQRPLVATPETAPTGTLLRQNLTPMGGPVG